jgi:acyl-CoA synthetase (AMP-forming)/AMP-acid ligase II/thioesterase domain-containing protein
LIQMVVSAGTRGPEVPALLAPGRDTLTYGRLDEFVAGTAGRLRAHGLGPQSRIALVVENGPEAATGFLSLAYAAAVAPLNPAYREGELAFSLDDLGADALVVGADLDSPAREVAAERGIEVFELHVDPAEPAGVFTLSGLDSETPAAVEPEPDEVALLLHTSGTTSRPKLVPLTHARLSASARNVAEALRLEPADRCLNVMPLFHIHGLVAALLASLTAGASVACTPGFHQLRFFEWLDELEPTWYTAVPTMHAAVLARAHEHAATLGRRRLRLIRSSSAALPVPVLEGLEAAFDAPVIEAYGMTEAAHQMASNPLPPDIRKPGSVGRPVGLEIAILGQAGDPLPVGDVGEVAIRGANVFSGYESNPEANDVAFTDGWFRTGDEGSLDGDGYLTLRGRIKEIINRGGEKISPLEVDEALLRHAAVEQAVTFAVADPQLGEEIAAAVVLAPDTDADERVLQDFVAEQLAPFKVPRRVLIVDEIPKGATGKVQRIGLAERLGADATSEPDRPASGFLEPELVEIWGSVLGREEVGVTDDFFALGGDSILGAEAVSRVRDLVDDPDLPLASIVRAPTPATMAREVFDHVGSGTWGTIPIRSSGSRTPLFLVHPADGDVLAFGLLGRRLSPEQPLYGLRARGIDDGTAPPVALAEMAADYVAAVRDVQPRGPYLLGGYCMGAPVAVEMAHRLEEDGERVAMLVLLDPRFRQPGGLRYIEWRARRVAALPSRVTVLAWRRARERQLAHAVKRRIRIMRTNPPDATEIAKALERIREEYPVTPFSFPAMVVLSDEFSRTVMPTWYLKAMVKRQYSWSRLPGRHSRLLLPPNVDVVAAEIDAALDAAVGSSAAA